MTWSAGPSLDRGGVGGGVPYNKGQGNQDPRPGRLTLGSDLVGEAVGRESPIAPRAGPLGVETLRT